MALIDSKAPELREVEDWVNSGPVSLEEGAYLLDFWSSSCIDCVEDLEAMRMIHSEYPVTVIGVHTPEFGFEQRAENVRKAVEKHGVDYPVAVDSEKSVWDSYGNSYWPGRALVKDGRVEWKDRGGSIRRLEQKVADILDTETGDVMPENGGGREISPDAYLGFRRCRGINDGANFRGEKQFELPDKRRLNRVYLGGRWSQREQHLEAVSGRLFFHYHASKVGLVAHPNGGIRDVEVRLDGRPVPRSKAGDDLRIEGDRSYVRVKEPGMYSIVSGQYSRSELSLEPEKRTRLYSLGFR